jgi:fructokinase
MTPPIILSCGEIPWDLFPDGPRFGGAAGALLVADPEVVDQPGIPTVVCDTVGVGDAFTATLVVGWLRRAPLPALARTACAIAAAVCAQPRAVPARPQPPLAAPSLRQ